MHLLGYAADGFPIYGPDGPADPTDLKSPPRRLRSSYRLRSGRRSGGRQGPVRRRLRRGLRIRPGLGDLDECNGRAGPTPEYPDGTYYYVLTDDFPFVPRSCAAPPTPASGTAPRLASPRPCPASCWTIAVNLNNY